MQIGANVDFPRASVKNCLSLSILHKFWRLWEIIFIQSFSWTNNIYSIDYNMPNVTTISAMLCYICNSPHVYNTFYVW